MRSGCSRRHGKVVMERKGNMLMKHIIIKGKHRYSHRVDSEGQHNSWQQSYSEDFDHLKEIWLNLLPQTQQAARFCILSNAETLFWVWGFQKILV